ncbi:hypothetical protein MPSEU_000628200 [Mayamaea pseudoterrestris]|nr:hypothetical protein MPSEU_000628200 [Mayamaea pseudoterrestris]
MSSLTKLGEKLLVQLECFESQSGSAITASQQFHAYLQALHIDDVLAKDPLARDDLAFIMSGLQVKIAFENFEQALERGTHVYFHCIKTRGEKAADKLYDRFNVLNLITEPDEGSDMMDVESAASKVSSKKRLPVDKADHPMGKKKAKAAASELTNENSCSLNAQQDDSVDVNEDFDSGEISSCIDLQGTKGSYKIPKKNTMKKW